MLMKINKLFIFCVIINIVFTGSATSHINGYPVEDKQALLEFIRKINHTRALNWDPRTHVCTKWIGVTCSEDRSSVTALRLPGFGLRGSIPANTIRWLTELRILSLHSNSLYGPFPSELTALKSLNALYLQYNNFSGPLPSDFTLWKNLSVLNLSNNGFTGSVPASISNLTRLTALNLSNNNLSGYLPKFLQGNFPSSAFSGNNFWRENNPPRSAMPPRQRHLKHIKRFGEPAILGVAVAGFVLMAAVIIFWFRKKERYGELLAGTKRDASNRNDSDPNHDERNKIVFFEGQNLVFDLEDLLRASAEVLGKGAFGTTYKATLDDSTTVVVKRLKDVTANKREFEQQMEIIGSMKHENVAELRGYFYSKDEKLTVYDYYDQRSVSSLLHGTSSETQIPLDWEARLKIIIGAARGIAYIHSQDGGRFVHGNIKSSNVFLNPKGNGCISDAGLATVASPLPSQTVRSSGYRAPEVTDTRKATQESDVYSFGVMVLEFLSGKSPVHATGRGEEVVNLVRWVSSVVREEWTAEVFDLELLRSQDAEEEMVETLRVGMACTARVPERRPKMVEAVRMVEEIHWSRSASVSSSSAVTPIASDVLVSKDLGILVSKDLGVL